ncbi:MAG TPA: Uma2 family endonuclease [Candidatus Baltobacteraceae bacterium]|nr:Uma2 family endonuclease [Candidatus Baltobacteraceae bacterium]
MREDRQTMHVIDEIDDSEKPYIEYLAGRAVPKVSPKRRHGIVQGRLWAILQELARGRGDVATEWRCYLPAEPRRTSLVPDVAFISNERLAPLTEDEREMPQSAPDIAIEVRSEDDKRKNLGWKIAAYLRHGAVLVLDVLPLERRIVAHTRAVARIHGRRPLHVRRTPVALVRRA